MKKKIVLKSATRSLCSVCFNEIPASVVEEPEGVFMEKECPDHGPQRYLIDRNAAVYRKLVSRDSAPRPRVSLIIPVTHRCNLKCRMCYLPDKGIPDPPKEKIFRLIDSFEGSILFAGGEPTLREDIDELISYASQQGKAPCVITNALRLNERSLLKRLEEAGLRNCVFSLNGLSDDIFNQIEGRPLLEKKMAALDMLRSSRIKPTLSTTIVSGVNEKELSSLAKLFLSSPDFFHGWRIRTQTAIGEHTGAPNISMSDMINIVCNTFDIEPNSLLECIDSKRIYHCASHLFFYLLSVEEEAHVPLGYSTMVRRALKGARIGRSAFGLPGPPGVVGRAKTFLHLLRDFGSRMSMPDKARILKNLLSFSRMRLYDISVFAWPNVNTVDLVEAERTGVYHVGPAGEIMPFQKGIILNDKKPCWDWRL